MMQLNAYDFAFINSLNRLKLRLKVSKIQVISEVFLIHFVFISGI